MTKKDFQLIADVIRTCACVSKEDVALAFVAKLKETSPRYELFDVNKFLKACGVKE